MREGGNEGGRDDCYTYRRNITLIVHIKPGLESWWGNEETEKAVKEKKDRLKTWKRTSAESDRKEYRLAKSTAKKVVARGKAEAIDGLYDNMETSEGQKDVYRIAAARDRAGKDIGQIRTIKSATGEVLMKDEYTRERWDSISVGS